ncbi:MAG TPA: glycosyltransferase family 4 protein [Gaiellaceae bacterium]|nr:glycosyltransferase family 4 protein [Gaiellaceae bacterium]
MEPPAIAREWRVRRDADVVVCWDERTGVSAALRSRIRGEPPSATGVIWATEGGRVPPAVAAALRSSAAVWALSTAQLDVLARSGLARGRLHYLPMGVDCEFWSPPPVAAEPATILTVGNDRHRDHATVVTAVATVRRSLPARLTLVTAQPVDVPAEIGARVSSADHRALRTRYAQAAVVALAVKPNLHVSGLTVVLESMAMGKAVVATRTPGIEAYVTDGVTGLLVEPGPDPLARAIRRLLSDPDEAAALGAAAQDDARRRFTTDRQAEALAGILDAAAS